MDIVANRLLHITIIATSFALFTCDKSDEVSLVLDDHEWKREYVYDFNNEVFFPLSMWYDQNGVLVIHDMEDQNYPIKIIKEGNVEKSISSGRGPGEVEYVLKKFFSESKDERYIFDAAQKRLLKFDSKYNYIEDVIDDRINDNVYMTGIYSDSLMVTISNNHILKIYNKQNNSLDDSILFDLYSDDYDFLNPLRNFFLRQDFFYATTEQDIYLGMRHASMIMHVDSSFNFNYTFGPDSIEIPVNEKDGFYALPRLGDQREGLRDLAVHGDYLFAVLNGKTYGKHVQIKHMTNFDHLLDVVRHGEILIVFDRHTLEFIKAIELPIAASNLAVNENNIFLLNYIDGFPSIYVYRNNIMDVYGKEI